MTKSYFIQNKFPYWKIRILKTVKKINKNPFVFLNIKN